jgi:hypothetical protein
VVALILAAPAIGADPMLWDTGAPHIVNFNGTETYLGYSSGNLGAGLEQRWAAVPFRISLSNAIITQIDVDWFVQPGQEANSVNYIIWHRNGLDAPTVDYSSGVLGAFGAGVDDPRVDGLEDWLHQYVTYIPIPAGDYYLTIYGDGGTAPNNTPWLTGGDLQEEALEQAFMWRSATFPSPGFVAYAPANILPGAGMTDADDRWNPSFTLYGTPEPSTLALLMGLAVLGLRRR